MKALKKSIIWILLLLYVVIVFGFVENRYEDQLCNKIEILITDSLNTGFVNNEDIVSALERHEINYLGVPLYEIDLDTIEKAIYSNQIIEHCRAYIGINGTLKVEISQRGPFVRILEETGKGYYLDRKGNVLNLSSRFTPHVLVVNGKFRSAIQVGSPMNILNSEGKEKNKKILEIFELASYIDSHDLWESQFVQVYINSGGEFELVPRVGPHIILLGPLDGYQKKLEKLEVFYKEGLNNIGWNQYLKINLKYKDQVVCTKI